MADENPEIPHFLDRLPNGRCRAWWMAYDACPGNQQPHEYATAHVDEYLEKAAALDAKHGMVTGCRGSKVPVLTPEEPAPIRKRQRPIRKRSRVAC